MYHNIIAVTSRKQCKGDFLQKIEEIAQAKPQAMILREKDLSEMEYQALAKQVLDICKTQDVPCILHIFWKTAFHLGCRKIHIPLHQLRHEGNRLHCFETVGTSIHSVEEAMEAQRLGADYVIAGHVFETECKAGVPPRGLFFLEEVVQKVNIPVYAIGGIKPIYAASVMNTGARGICIMSGLMQCEEAKAYLETFQ